MRSLYSLATISLFVCFTCIGCGSKPAPTVAQEKPKPFGVKDLDGVWLLKSSTMSSAGGMYSSNTKDGDETVLRVRDGVTEVRKGNGPWAKFGSISLGSTPNCLHLTKQDITGKDRVLKLRFKVEGNTLITVEDKLYPDVLPESFEMETGAERQRQTNTYVKTDG